MKLALGLMAGCAIGAAGWGAHEALATGGLGFAWLSGALAVLAIWCALHGADMERDDWARSIEEAAARDELDAIAPRVRERVQS